jgi:ribosome modulation factor
MKRAALALLLLLVAPSAFAWPTSLVECLIRDARRLVPKSLAHLIYDRETKILEQAQHFPADLGQLLIADLSAGELKPATLAALDAQASAALPLFKELRVSEGIVLLGATLRIPADLSDPALASGPEGFPAGVTREYYAFIEANLGRLPVVLDDEKALKLRRADLRAYWSSLLEKSREDAPRLRAELYRGGRVVDHRTLDWHSPVFAVAQVSYSRAVTGIAATWLAVWRDARGDMTRMKAPVEVAPSDRPPEGQTP